MFRSFIIFDYVLGWVYETLQQREPSGRPQLRLTYVHEEKSSTNHFIVSKQFLDEQKKKKNIYQQIIRLQILYTEKICHKGWYAKHQPYSINIVEFTIYFKAPFCKIFHCLGCLMAYPYLPTPPLGQDMTQGQFLSRV